MANVTRPAVCGAIIIAALLQAPRDASAQTLQRVNIASDGTPANHGINGSPSINADGRFVAFDSFATNLVAGDTNGTDDVFVHDRLTGITTRESVGAGGTQGNSASSGSALSADGRFVAFYSRATNLTSDVVSGYQVYVRDRTLGVTTLVSQSAAGVPGNGNSLSRASISADGRFVSFNSNASNLVSGDTNGISDIFTRDLLPGTITRDSVASDGTQTNGFGSDSPALSSDGRYVAFTSTATNLIPSDGFGEHVFVRDRVAGVTTLESVGNSGETLNGARFPSLSGDGRLVTFSQQLNGLFLRDRQTGQTLGSSNLSKFVIGPTLSPDGRYLVFAHAPDGNIMLGFQPYIVGVHDRVTGQSHTVASGAQPAAANNAVAFVSSGALVPDDTNGVADIYVFAEPLGQNRVPGPPVALVASSTASRATLAWIAPSTGGAVTNYIVEAGSQSGLADLASISTGTTTTSFSADNIRAGTYYVRVRASNANGASVPSPEAVLVVGSSCPGPGAPGNLSASGSGSTVTLTWLPGSGATSYLLLAGSSPGLSDILAIDLGSSSTALTATNVARRTYYVRLQSLNACGQSVASNEVFIVRG